MICCRPVADILLPVMVHLSCRYGGVRRPREDSREASVTSYCKPKEWPDGHCYITLHSCVFTHRYARPWNILGWADKLGQLFPLKIGSGKAISRGRKDNLMTVSEFIWELKQYSNSQNYDLAWFYLVQLDSRRAGPSPSGALGEVDRGGPPAQVNSPIDMGVKQ